MSIFTNKKALIIAGIELFLSAALVLAFTPIQNKLNQHQNKKSVCMKQPI